MGRLAVGRVETGGGEGTEGVKDGLSGRVVADDGTHVVLLQEGHETSKVNRTGQGRKGFVEGELGGGDQGRGTSFQMVHVGTACAKMLVERCDTAEEIELAIVVWEGGHGSSRQAATHAGRTSWGAGRGCGENSRVCSSCGGRWSGDRGLRQFEDVLGGDRSNASQRGVDGGEVGGGGSHLSVHDAGLSLLGVRFTGCKVHGHGKRVATEVQEVGDGVGDSRVAWAKEGIANGVADELAFVIDGSEILRDHRSQGVEDGTGGDGRDMGFQGGNGGTKGNLLVHGVSRNGRESG